MLLQNYCAGPGSETCGRAHMDAALTFLNTGMTYFLGVGKGQGFVLFTSANVNELHRFKRRVQLLVLSW